MATLESKIRERDEIIEKFGSWTAHNLDLGDGLYTISERLNYDTIKLRRVIQAISDLNGGKLETLRVLDLAVLEGLYTVEFGLQNVREAIGVEFREANIRKAEFSRNVLQIKNVRFIQDDVRKISEAKVGRFDVILCLGLLYHLDSPAVFQLLENLSTMTDHYLVIDTHTALEIFDKAEYRGHWYAGQYVPEFKKGMPKSEMIKHVWSGIDNERNFVMTKTSLVAFLSRMGFTSVFECHAPLEYVKPIDRVTLVAVKGGAVKLRSFPRVNTLDEAEIKTAILKDGDPILVREHFLIAVARRAFGVLKRIIRRCAVGPVKEE